jgi:hypothetical protein
VSDVHVVDTLIGKAWCDLDVLFLHVQDEWEKLLYTGGRDIVSVRPLDQGLEG